ncbi:MAG: hypothetical protein ACYTG7_16575 [Planctomycetota bacterium]
MANRLCLHNGGEYYLIGYEQTVANNGAGRYFPSFTHRPALGVGGPENTTWPWKIRGWAWTGMMADKCGPTWYWESLLHKSRDNPWATTMSWDYPINYALGIVPHSGSPRIYYASNLMSPPLPSYVHAQEFVFPSSCGGFDSSLNVFVVTGETWIMPSTLPYYGYDFGIILSASAALHVSSGASIWEYVYHGQGPLCQYMVLSGNELDCLGGPGNKGRGYSLVKPGDCGYVGYFPNHCDGAWYELAMCLFVEDPVSIPVNDPGVTSKSNPFAAYGFDIGVATVTPLYSSEGCKLRIMTEDYANPGGGRVLLAGSPWIDMIPFGSPAPGIPYGPIGFRLPHTWDMFTDFFSSLSSVWYHETNPGYPAGVFGTTTGGHSDAILVPRIPGMIGIEIFFSTFSTKGKAPSAAFMMTMF